MTQKIATKTNTNYEEIVLGIFHKSDDSEKNLTGVPKQICPEGNAICPSFYERLLAEKKEISGQKFQTNR